MVPDNLTPEQIGNLLWLHSARLDKLEIPANANAWHELSKGNAGIFLSQLYCKLKKVEAGLEVLLWVTVRCTNVDDVTHLLPSAITLFAVRKPILLGKASLAIKPRGLLAEATITFIVKNLDALRDVRVFLADEGRYCWTSRHVHCAGCGKQRPAKVKDWSKSHDPGPGDWPLWFCSDICCDAYEACRIPHKPFHVK